MAIRFDDEDHYKLHEEINEAVSGIQKEIQDIKDTSDDNRRRIINYFRNALIGICIFIALPILGATVFFTTNNAVYQNSSELTRIEHQKIMEELDEIKLKLAKLTAK